MCEDFEKVSEFHKQFSICTDIAAELDALSTSAIVTAQSRAKDAKVIVLESLLLEAINGLESNPENKKAKSAIGAQKSFISSNVMGVTEDDILPQIMQKANSLAG